MPPDFFGSPAQRPSVRHREQDSRDRNPGQNGPRTLGETVVWLVGLDEDDHRITENLDEVEPSEVWAILGSNQ